MAKPKSLAVIGAGFFGLSAALTLSKLGNNVVVYEKNVSAMQQASRLNQARVHGGYHYPRSLVTAARCRANYEKFVQDYKTSIFDDFQSVYAIACDSKVNSQKFSRLMKMIGSPIEKLTNSPAANFNPSLISDAFKVSEVAFNSDILMSTVMNRLSRHNVQIRFENEVIEIEKLNTFGKKKIKVKIKNGLSEVHDGVIVATYGIDLVNSNFSEDFLYEVCELIRVEPPEPLIKTAITVMDGPYWSLTPWPSLKSHVLTHVRHTPHARFAHYSEASEFFAQKLETRAELMIKDASRYMPIMSECKILGSEYIIKTILKKRDYDDARPIYIKQDDNILSILGSKIDNVYEVDKSLESFMMDIY